MKVLALDTAMNAGSVAVADGPDILSCVTEPNSRTLAERLMPMVEQALDAAGLGYADLDRLGVTIGPGTFTGMRIGMSAARAMALASGLPLVGLSTLEVIARQAADAHPSENTITVCFDARRNEAYIQAFDCVGGDVTAAGDPAILPVDQVRDQLAGFDGLVVGSGVPLVADMPGLRVGEGFDGIDVATLASLSLDRPVPDHLPDPLYIRAPDAKLPGGKDPG